MKYTFHPHARKELNEAVAYYGSSDPEVGKSFLRELSKTLSRIQSFPEACAKTRSDIRRCRVDRFPYEVLYEIERSKIFILAVMHYRRRPDYWIERLK
jgi:plasmid stabilization system protein ParE